MKKKQFHSKLNLKKHKISNLQENSVQGGTDSIATATYIIINTIKVLTEHITRRICPTHHAPCPVPDPEPWSEDTMCV
jgi:hypothetical protein